MLLNPKSPYLGVGCEYKHILQILKVYLGQFFVFDNPKRDHVCCSVEGKTPANRAPGLQASIRAIHCLSSRHPSLIPLSTETLLIQSWSEKESIKPPIHVAVSLRIIFATIRRVCLVKYLLDSIQQEGMLIFSTLPLTHIMWPGDCDIPGWRFDVTGALTCPLIQPASCP